MRKISKRILLMLFLTSMMLPLIPMGRAQQPRTSAIPMFIVGSSGTSGNWDSVSYLLSSGDWFMGTLENLFYTPDGWSGDYDELIPALATSWTFDYWPEQMNGQGFVNRNGIKKVTVTLREGVKFHDGSDWNATVAKWNFDRIQVATGNITGDTPNEANVMNARRNWWLPAAKWAIYETPGWNVSKFINTMPSYAEFGITQDNPLVSGFWGQYPRIKNVTIIDDQQSGGTFEINLNDWGIGFPGYMMYLSGMMSMDTYKDYFGIPIFGYGEETGFPQDSTFQHLIGTGPYKFVEFDTVVLEGGTMERFDEWWNATEQQDDGWHMVPEITISTFPQSQSGYDLRNTAMVTGDIDFAFDTNWEPLVYDDMIATPTIRYVERDYQAYGENLILNCIDETYIKAWSTFFVVNATDMGWAGWVADSDYNYTVGGINRAFRKALSFAYNYTSFIDIAKDGRAVRSGGYVGVDHEYHDDTIDIAETDLTIARQALLDDPFWGAVLAAKNLGITNTTQEWRNVAASGNPVYALEHVWDTATMDVTNVLEESIKNLGMVLDDDPALQAKPSLYSTMTESFSFPWFTFDSTPSRWYIQDVGALGWLEAYYASPGVYDSTVYGYKVADWIPGSLIFPGEAFYNMGFSYNSTFDRWISEAWFANETRAQELYSNMAEWTQNYQYPFVYIAQDKIGHAINTEWDYSFKWGWFNFALVKHLGDSGVPPIPGFSVGILFAVSTFASIGIIYAIMRKKKLK